MIIWDCSCCISVNIWKFCICSCHCLVCCSMTCIKSWCCSLDCSSFLLSASSRCFRSCIPSNFHFYMRSFFSRKYAIMSLPLLRRFTLAAVSFSTSSFLCLFFLVLSRSSFSQGSLELCISFPLLSPCWVSPYSLLKTWRKENKRTHGAISLALVLASTG